MAAASADPSMRAGAVARVGPYATTCVSLAIRADGVARRASVTGFACALLAGSGAALVTQAGFGQHAGALWLSALTLAAMISVPSLMSRSTGAHTTLATATTLIVTITAMNAVPAYLNGLAHGPLFAVLMLMVGTGALLYRPRLASANANATVEPRRHDKNSFANSTRTSDSAPPIASLNTDKPARGRQLASMTALLALLAGLSSGTLARFQLYAVCGASGAQPFWRIALALIAVCALACLADRSRGNATLTALYLARAALIGTLALTDSPTLAPLAATVFLVLDCLTIPALLNLRGNATGSVLSLSCPGVAHHVGMVLGAALSTTSYFFGDGFVVLYALSAAANVICAASLTNHRRPTNPRQHDRYSRQTRPSA